MKSQRQQQLEAFLMEDPDDPFTHYALALEYLKAGDKNGTLEKLEWLITHHASYLATYYQLGKLYEEMGHHARAIDIFARGMVLAEQQKNRNTFNELKSAKEELELD